MGEINMMKIAVTGASGFIGRHVLAQLAHHPVEVIAATRDAAKLVCADKNFHVVELDIANPRADDYERLHRPDVLIHLAWAGLPEYKSLHHFETELPRQYLFLKGLVHAGLPALLVAGTCFEYGMQSGLLSEEMTPLPCTAYGYAKAALHRQLEFLRGKHSFALTWARLFYLYGEGQSKSSLLPQLQESIAQSQTTFNMSGGEQLRDYLPVDEVASILVELALRKEDLGVVNVCSGVPVSICNLVERWLKANGWTIGLNLGYYDYPDYEPMAFWGCRRRLNTILDKP